MAISSIHFQAVTKHSVFHNERKDSPTYLIDDPGKNAFKSIKSINEYESNIRTNYKSKIGRSLQKKSVLVKEAVVNLNANHTLDDIESLAYRLQKDFGYVPLHIAIHHDEGHILDDGTKIHNRHAHLILGNFKEENFKSVRMSRKDMSQMQTIVSKQLDMERGQEGSTAVRMDHKQFKAMKRAVKEAEQTKDIEIVQLKNENKDLKNKLLKKGEIESAFKELRQELIARGKIDSGQKATQSDYQLLKSTKEQLKKDGSTIENLEKTIKDLRAQLHLSEDNLDMLDGVFDITQKKIEKDGLVPALITRLGDYENVPSAEEIINNTIDTEQFKYSDENKKLKKELEAANSLAQEQKRLKELAEEENKYQKKSLKDFFALFNFNYQDNGGFFQGLKSISKLVKETMSDFSKKITHLENQLYQANNRIKELEKSNYDLTIESIDKLGASIDSKISEADKKSSNHQTTNQNDVGMKI